MASKEKDGKQIFLEFVVPALGALVSTLMYFAPLRAVLKAGKDRSLGDLNPFPFGVTIANTIVWLSYGLIKRDPFVTCPNTPGVVVAVFNTLTSYGLADEAKRSRLKMVCCLTAGVLPVLGVCTAFAAKDAAARLGIWGFAGNIIALVYYGAPLSSMYDVIRTRNSASILLPLTLMNTANAALWTTYGFAVADPYIWVPNGIGLALSVAQIVLRAVFPGKPAPLAGSLPSHQHHAGKYTRLDEDALPASDTPKELR